MAGLVADEPGSWNLSGLPSSHPTRSYWLKDPSPVLLGHRTTPDLPGTADIFIIGSGITGTFAARTLLHDLSSIAPATTVVMLEAREACWGATGRNGGHCQAQLYAHPEQPDIPRFEQATFHFLRDLVAAHKIPCEWRTLPGGCVTVSTTPDVFAPDFAAKVRRLERTAPDLAALIELVDAAQPAGRARLARMRIPTVAGALVIKEAATLSPYKLVAWVLETLLAGNDAVRSGSCDDPLLKPKPRFNLQTKTPAMSLQRLRDEDGAGWRWVVTTPRGSVRARQVLLATNGYTSALLPGFADLIVPVCSQVVALQPPTDPPLALESSYCMTGSLDPADRGSGDNWRAYRRNQYLQQRPDNQIVCGGASSQQRALGIGEWRDDTISAPAAKWLRERLHPVPLDLRSAGERRKEEAGEETSEGANVALDTTHEWTGIFGLSRDEACWVGEVPANLLPGKADGDGLEAGKGGSSLWVCAAYSGHGMPVAPLAASAVARAMVGEPMTADGDETPFPERFLLTEERVRRAREEHKAILKEGRSWWSRLGGEKGLRKRNNRRED